MCRFSDGAAIADSVEFLIFSTHYYEMSVTQMGPRVFVDNDATDVAVADGGGEVMSASMSASVPDTQSVAGSQADNRITSELIVDETSEKCDLPLFH